MDNQYTIYLLRKSDDGKQHISEEKYRFYYDYDVSLLDASAVMSVDDYSRIFQVRPNRAKRHLKRLAVVKISYTDECGKTRTIYRKFRKTRNHNFKKGVAITSHSMLFLKDDDEDLSGKVVSIEKGSICGYYFNHPDEIVHASIILAVVSLTLGFLSILLSITQ